MQVHHQTDGQISASNGYDLKIVIQHEIVTYQLIRFFKIKTKNAFKSYFFIYIDSSILPKNSRNQMSLRISLLIYVEPG